MDALVDAIGKKKARVDIIVSHHNDVYTEGYSDDMGGKALQGVIIDRLALRLGSRSEAEKLAAKYLKIRQTTDNFYNHSKVWIVDDHLFYIGSDNIYPAYLQEYGYITGNTALCNKFISDYWVNMWNSCRPVSPTNEGRRIIGSQKVAVSKSGR